MRWSKAQGVFKASKIISCRLRLQWLFLINKRDLRQWDLVGLRGHQELRAESRKPSFLVTALPWREHPHRAELRLTVLEDTQLPIRASQGSAQVGVQAFQDNSFSFLFTLCVLALCMT